MSDEPTNQPAAVPLADQPVEERDPWNTPDGKFEVRRIPHQAVPLDARKLSREIVLTVWKYTRLENFEVWLDKLKAQEAVSRLITAALTTTPATSESSHQPARIGPPPDDYDLDAELKRIIEPICGHHCGYCVFPDTTPTSEAEDAERETLIYWLLRCYQSGHREGWEDGPSVKQTMDSLLDVLANRGYDPNEDDAARELLKQKPRF